MIIENRLKQHFNGFLVFMRITFFAIGIMLIINHRWLTSVIFLFFCFAYIFYGFGYCYRFKPPACKVVLFNIRNYKNRELATHWELSEFDSHSSIAWKPCHEFFGQKPFERGWWIQGNFEKQNKKRSFTPEKLQNTGRGQDKCNRIIRFIKNTCFTNKNTFVKD